MGVGVGLGVGADVVGAGVVATGVVATGVVAAGVVAAGVVGVGVTTGVVGAGVTIGVVTTGAVTAGVVKIGVVGAGVAIRVGEGVTGGKGDGVGVKSSGGKTVVRGPVGACCPGAGVSAAASSCRSRSCWRRMIAGSDLGAGGEGKEDGLARGGQGQRHAINAHFLERRPGPVGA